MNGEDGKEKLEREMARTLTEGDMAADDPDETAVSLLPAKYEIRMAASKDPIVEETKAVRKLAKEVDNRYDKVMNSRDNDE